MRGYLWPYRRALAIMAGTAVVGVFVSLAIPLLFSFASGFSLVSSIRR